MKNYVQSFFILDAGHRNQTLKKLHRWRWEKFLTKKVLPYQGLKFACQNKGLSF